VSSREQGDSGLGLAAQTTKIAETIARHRWTLVADLHDVATGKSPKRRTSLDSTREARPALDKALNMLEANEADVLVVSKLDRLARSVRDFGDIVALSIEQGWSLKILDPDIDTSTPNGRLCAGMLALLSEWEGEIISQRTKEGLAERRSQGHRLGGAPETAPKTEQRIVSLYEAAPSFSAIARQLNEENVPTARGGKWYPATVRTILKRNGALAQV
jgi:DNA invertase Pin-like site-specific DNA recombinase